MVSVEKNKPFCLQYVQLVKTTNWSLKTSGRGFIWYKDIHDFMLDATYPYNGETCRAEAGPIPIVMKDTPNAPLENMTSIIDWDEEFQTYLMFRPGHKGDQNAWIPLRRVDWGWKAKATSKINPWRYSHPVGNTVPIPPCKERFDLHPKRLPVNFKYRIKKATAYPKWSATSPENGFIHVTDIKVEDDGDNYKTAKTPPK